jgi:hypothetical protein
MVQNPPRYLSKDIGLPPLFSVADQQYPARIGSYLADGAGSTMEILLAFISTLVQNSLDVGSSNGVGCQ